MIDNKITVVGKVYDYLLDTPDRINLLYGSAGSSKSWQIAIFLLVEKFIAEVKIRILVIRKTLPALRKSAYTLMMDRLRDMNVKVRENKTMMTIRYLDNEILFASLDDIEKLKSIEGINYIWVEEATEISYNDYLQLDLRCRGKNQNGENKLFYSFNPIDINHFLKPLTELPPPNTGVLHTTYKDNMFLDEVYTRQIEGLIDQDVTYYKIYALGQWAAPEGLIYRGWDSVKSEGWPTSFDEIGYGLDFGYNNPTALIEVGRKDQEVYVREMIYESELLTSELIQRMDELGIDKRALIVADCAEPDRIEEIYQSGDNVHAADKSQGSVEFGIDVVKSQTVHYHEESVNLYKEYVSYKWREDKSGNVLDEPVKFNDHAMDAMRYCIAKDDSLPQALLLGGRERYDPSPERREQIVTMGDIFGEKWYDDDD